MSKMIDWRLEMLILNKYTLRPVGRDEANSKTFWLLSKINFQKCINSNSRAKSRWDQRSLLRLLMLSWHREPRTNTNRPYSVKSKRKQNGQVWNACAVTVYGNILKLSLRRPVFLILCLSLYTWFRSMTLLHPLIRTRSFRSRKPKMRPSTPEGRSKSPKIGDHGQQHDAAWQPAPRVVAAGMMLLIVGLHKAHSPPAALY